MNMYKRMFLVCIITEIVFSLGAILIPVIDQVMIFKNDEASFTIVNGVIYNINSEAISHPNLYIQSLIYLVRDLILSFLLWQSGLIFRVLRNQGWFNENRNGIIYKIGIGFILFSFYLFLSDMILVNLQRDGAFTFVYQLDNLKYIPIGFTIITLGYVLKVANSINEEQKLVI
ncbi:hypothetical protein HU15_003861 [Salmonella enterica subsp. enterica serovar Gaminara]|nr:hypothetical protein [Salmonella enterica subsp. enterica serovar Gaminara]ELW6131314.1 hypothetical protein [Salmonella enterica]